MDAVNHYRNQLEEFEHRYGPLEDIIEKEKVNKEEKKEDSDDSDSAEEDQADDDEEEKSPATQSPKKHSKSNEEKELFSDSEEEEEKGPKKSSQEKPKVKVTLKKADKKKFKCPVCGKKLARAWCVERHVKKFHREQAQD